MSYDIYFIKKKDLSSDNIYDVLEISEPKPDNEMYISKDMMKLLIKEMKSERLEFEVFEGKDQDYFELNFPTYQMSMFNSQIVISVPYFDENSNDAINKEIKQIINVLLNNNLKGFDSQTEQFITEPYEHEKTFKESKTLVNDNINSNTQGTNTNTMMYVGIGLGITLLGLLVWKMINK